MTTDNEIVTTEILKHRHIGRYMEHTQYWQRKVSIPLDAPRKQVDYNPIRSGLRKRKRAESPVSAEPKVNIHPRLFVGINIVLMNIITR